MTDQTSTLRISLIDDVSKTAAAMADAIGRAEAQAKLFDEAMARAGSANVSQKLLDRLKAMGAGAGHVEGVAKAFKQLAEAEKLAEDRSKWTTAQVQAVRNLESVTVSAVRSQIGMERSLAEEQQRSHIRRMRDLETERERFRHHFKELGREALAATGYMGLGYGAVTVGERSFEKGMELQGAQGSLGRAGMTPGDIARLQRQSLAISGRVGTVSQTDIMELGKEVRSVLGKPGEIFQILEPLAKAKASLELAAPGSSEGIGSIIKGAEAIGRGQHPAEMIKMLDAYVKAIQVMGKTINPEQIYEFDRGLRASGSRLSDRFLTLAAPSIIQELGGEGAGKGVNEMIGQLTGGLGRRSVAVDQLMNLGLIKRSDIKFSKTGEVIGVQKGRVNVVEGTPELMSDPDKFVYDILGPRLKAKYGDDEIKRDQAIRQIFSGSKAAADIVIKMFTQEDSWRQHQAMLPTAAGIKAADQQNANAAAGITALTTAIGNFESQVTLPLMEPIGKGLHLLADGINALAKAVQDHPVAGPATAIGAGVGVLALSTYGTIKSARAATRWLTGRGGPTDAADAAHPAQSQASVMETATKVAEQAAKAVETAKIPATARWGASVDLGTLGMLWQWAQQKDVLGLDAFSNSFVKKGGALPFALPGDAPAGQGWAPADAADRMKRREDLINDENDRIKDSVWQFGQLNKAVSDCATKFADLKTMLENASGNSILMGDAGSDDLMDSGAGPKRSGRLFGGGGFAGAVRRKSATEIGEHEAFIRQYAASIGISPDVAAAVSRSEGLGASWAGGDRGTSYGDFQMHFGGSGIRGMNAGGLGDIYNRVTRKDARDPRNWRDVDGFALRWAKKHGWGDWHGAARVHIGRYQGLGMTPVGSIPSTSADEALTTAHPSVAGRHATDHLTGGHAMLSPNIDTQHLERTAGLLDHIHGRMAAINAMSGGVARPGSFRSALNGNFASNAWERTA